MRKNSASQTTGMLSAIAAIALATPVLSVNAATETFNGTFSATTLGNNLNTTLSQFDSTLGTLTGVTLTLDINVTSVATILNVSSGNRTFTSSDSTVHSYSPSDIFQFSLGTDSWNLAAPTVSTGIITGTGQVLPNFTTLNFVGPTSASIDLNSVAGLDLAAYSGSGLLTFLSIGSSGPGQSSGTGPFFNVVSGLGGYAGGTANLDGTASVTYTFSPEPVPEPSTLALLALGGAGFLLRKRQKS